MMPLKGLISQKDLLKDLRNYLAGRAEGLSRDEALLEEVLKCAFAFHNLELDGSVKDLPEDTSAEKIAVVYRRAFENVCERFTKLFPLRTQILLGPENILYIHRTFIKITQIKENEDDLIGDIYEIFIGNSYRGQEGQYFTPVTAIKALIEITQPKKNDLIIDPACGAGGFLIESCKYIGNQLNPSNIYGIDKDNYLARLTNLRLSLKYDTIFNIYSGDSLTLRGEDLKNPKLKDKVGHFDLCLTNPPFGRKIVSLSDRDKVAFELAHKWKFSKKKNSFEKTDIITRNTPPQILFIERCLSLLRPGGVLGIVVPESILSNSGSRYVVNYILEHSTPKVIIGMPESLFKISGKGGTHTKVCLLVTEKKVKKRTKVFMAEAKWCGHDSRGKKIPHNDIPKIVEKYLLSHDKDEVIKKDRFGFFIKRNEIKNFILAPRYYNPEPANTLKKLTSSHNIIKISELIQEGILTITTGDELGKLAYGTGDIPFIRTSDISNWEIKADPKHLVAEEYYKIYAPKQDVREGDILMVRDGTYLIGTCAMITKYDTKIIFQSHLFKIRVNKNDLFDNYLLLAILSSNPVQTQIKSLSFTMDIIDSLGDRLKEVCIPIPKDTHLKKKISQMVKKVIDERIEARELARTARELVVNGH